MIDWSKSVEPVETTLGEPREKRKLWLNLHRSERSADDQVWKTREDADRYCFPEERIACVQIEVEFTPGEGLEEGK